ncbi:Protein phosphatase ImpM [hydrothermal vent metagenome]|uniref:Protein phosphatase ImpM n=1 Tax=hydrothermal vent metagenome TaxID=652676 RepID=A0A3B0VYF0_9ZZZZ
MNKNSSTCGLFGKSPQKTDFISHFLPNEFTENWHNWLQSSLSVSREQLGENWLDYYLTSPIWNYAIMPDVITPQAITGVLVPSIDEIGRYFPLTIAHIGAQQPWAAYLYGNEWYRNLQDVALHALNENTSYSQLIDQLEKLPILELPKMPDYTTQMSTHTFAHNQVIIKPTQQTNQELALSLLTKTYARLLGNYSLWWTEGSEHVEPCLILSANLPDPGQFAAMLDGNWQQWGWAEETIIQNE